MALATVLGSFGSVYSLLCLDGRGTLPPSGKQLGQGNHARSPDVRVLAHPRACSYQDVALLLPAGPGFRGGLLLLWLGGGVRVSHHLQRSGIGADYSDRPFRAEQ